MQLGDVVYHTYSARVRANKSGNEVDVVSVNMIRFNEHGKVVEMSLGGNTRVAAAYGWSMINTAQN